MELSLTRLKLLLEKQFIENRRFYLMALLAMMGLMLFIFLFPIFQGDTDSSKRTQLALFFLGMNSFGCFFSLTLFKSLEVKTERAQFLLNPASSLEKLLCAIIYGAVLFPAVYVIFIYPVTIIANLIESLFFRQQQPAAMLMIFSNLKGIQIFVFSFYVLQALVMAFSVFFRRFRVVKSAVLLCLIFFGSLMFNSMMMKKVFPHTINKEIRLNLNHPADDKVQMVTVEESFRGGFGGVPYTEARYFSDSRGIAVGLPFYQQLGFYILLCLSIPFLWLITWFRLRESEIN